MNIYVRPDLQGLFAKYKTIDDFLKIDVIPAGVYDDSRRICAHDSPVHGWKAGSQIPRNTRP